MTGNDLPRTESFDPGALLSRTYALSNGERVRLRLPHGHDAVGIRGLCERAGVELGDLELARLVRFDPRRQLVVCATTVSGSADNVVGVGAIELDPGALRPEPEILIVDNRAASGLSGLLRNALVGRAKVIARGRAA